MPPPRKLFVNIAVKDLDASRDFFTALGFSFDPRITDESGTGMIVSEDAYVMLLREGRFADFIHKPRADATARTEVILAFSAESREDVDRLMDLAVAGGGAEAGEPKDHGFMYYRSFTDLDGHQWEVAWMDMAAFGEG